MKKIEYEITFHSDWHCGSGLAAGADVDALVIKDKDGLPFVPGRTIKGLLREAAEVIGGKKMDDLFGKESEQMSALFFSNAVMREEERTAIVSNKIDKYMYRSISSTAIDDVGIAKDNSLRKVQVTVPCVLQGEIVLMSEELDNRMGELEELFGKAFQYVKRLGVGRNRGLGRCTIASKKGGAR